MRECLGKHSCMSSKYPIDILNGCRIEPSFSMKRHDRNGRRVAYHKLTIIIIIIVSFHIVFETKLKFQKELLWLLQLLYFLLHSYCELVRTLNNNRINNSLKNHFFLRLVCSLRDSVIL